MSRLWAGQPKDRGFRLQAWAGDISVLQIAQAVTVGYSPVVKAAGVRI